MSFRISEFTGASQQLCLNFKTRLDVQLRQMRLWRGPRGGGSSRLPSSIHKCSHRLAAFQSILCSFRLSQMQLILNHLLPDFIRPSLRNVTDLPCWCTTSSPPSFRCNSDGSPCKLRRWKKKTASLCWLNDLRKPTGSKHVAFRK